MGRLPQVLSINSLCNLPWHFPGNRTYKDVVSRQAGTLAMNRIDDVMSAMVLSLQAGAPSPRANRIKEIPGAVTGGRPD